jgi:L-ascorbate metabolism protein UlaG (beta-lactamase superfamily)
MAARLQPGGKAVPQQMDKGWGMRRSALVVAFLLILFLAVIAARAEAEFDMDIIETVQGPLQITFIGHGTLMFTFGGKVIHVDPVSREADYSKMEKADLILITHEHHDHLDPQAIELVRTERTSVVLTEVCARQVSGGVVMKNGEVSNVQGFRIEAVPAYNLVHMRSPGVPFHPKGVGNGYIITFGKKRVYVAGDTENIPEMKKLKNIDVAFLPMNLPYTMTPEMVADAAKAFKPAILYPYHYGETDTSRLVELLKGVDEVEVRIRRMK